MSFAPSPLPAVFEEFLDDFEDLPAPDREAVSRAVRHLALDPGAALAAAEPDLSPLDPGFRFLAAAPEAGLVLFLSQDAGVALVMAARGRGRAREWATRRRISISRTTGALQVLVADDGPRPAAAPGSAPGPLARATDEDLRAVGVPPERLGRVREARSGRDVSDLSALLPPEAFEATLRLAAAEPREEVLRRLGFPRAARFDTNDFRAALGSVLSLRRFTLLAGPEDAGALLAAPRDRWRFFPAPVPLRIATESFSGPALVLGGAGTGKTALAIRRAHHLALRVFRGARERVLLATLTSAQAAAARAALTRLGPPEAVARIEVEAFDAWMEGILLRGGSPWRIAFWPDPRLARLWAEALMFRPEDVDAGFLREEWEAVVLGEGCRSFEDYRAAARPGRGAELGRRERKRIWPVFESYRLLLDAHGLRERDDAAEEAVRLVARIGGPPGLRAAVVDSAEELGTRGLAMLRAAVPAGPDGLFLLADPRQQVLREEADLDAAGVDVGGRTRVLATDFRSTAEIRATAAGVLAGAVRPHPLDVFGEDRFCRALAHGPAPLVRTFRHMADEAEEIVRFVGEGDPRRTCILARTPALLEAYERTLSRMGMPVVRLGTDGADDPTRPGTRLATMEAAKGLEYDRVVVAGVNEGTVPLPPETEGPGAAGEEAVARERRLFHVALSRARRRLLVTAHGRASPWITGERPSR